VPRHNELQATRIASGLQLSKIEGLECREYSLSSDWRTGRLWVAGRIPSESCDLRDAAEFVEKCVPWFQPIVDLRTGLLSRFEVLARWEHPERGIGWKNKCDPSPGRHGMEDQLRVGAPSESRSAVARKPYSAHPFPRGMSSKGLSVRKTIASCAVLAKGAI
jgi:hypothetical protein